MEYRNINSAIVESSLNDTAIDVINISNETIFFIVLVLCLMIVFYFYFKYKSNIQTVNIDKTKKDYEPVDRTTPLGNPFKLKDFPLGKSIRYYEGYLNYMVYEKKDKAIIKQLNDLYGKSKAGKVNLGCHCKPFPCHSNVISKFIKNMKEEL